MRAARCPVAAALRAVVAARRAEADALDALADEVERGVRSACRPPSSKPGGKIRALGFQPDRAVRVAPPNQTRALPGGGSRHDRVRHRRPAKGNS